MSSTNYPKAACRKNWSDQSGAGGPGKTPVSRADAEETLDLTQAIIEEASPRLAGSAQAKHCADLLSREMEPNCDRVEQEPFDVHPEAFLGFLRVVTVLHLAGVIALAAGVPLLAAVLMLGVGIVGTLEFFFYRQFLDPFFPKKTGVNVIGVIEPAGEVRKQVIVSGHHDSAYEFIYLNGGSKVYVTVMVTSIVTLFLSMILVVTTVVMTLVNGGAPGLAGILRWALLGTIPLVLPLWWFLGKKGTPGAGDNLIASAIATRLARVVRRQRQAGHEPLKHTRLLLVSFDAEESGLRGAHAYARRHEAELKATPTVVFNMDSLYETKHLAVLTRDINGSISLPKFLAERVEEIAARLGLPMKRFPMHFGAGGTDAAEFARIGIPATTLLGLETARIQGDTVYHTQKDTVDKIEPEVVKAALEIAWEFVVGEDEKAA